MAAIEDRRRDAVYSKVPAVTIGFWAIKILATTLGETGGDTVSMTLNWGYLAATGLFAAILVALVWAQIAASRFHPFLYWATIVASTTAGTTMADFATRSLGIGYTGGSLLLLVMVMTSLFAWHRRLGTVNVNKVVTPQAETFYWITITFFANARDRAWRLARRQRRARLHRCGRGVRRRARDLRGPLLSHECKPGDAVLGCLHLDPPTGGSGRRFPGQAAGPWRAGAFAPACKRRSRRRDRPSRADPSTARRRASWR